jgi:hypothetical protein
MWPSPPGETRGHDRHDADHELVVVEVRGGGAELGDGRK